jgi:hypothetical protein
VHLPSPTATVLYSTPAGIGAPLAWSPDRTKVAFVVQGSTIRVSKANGSGTVSLAGTSGGVVLSWQP